MATDLRERILQSLDLLRATYDAASDDGAIAVIDVVYPTGGAAGIRRRLTVAQLIALDAALLAACARARCLMCGELSPADDLLEPAARHGWTCQSCEG